MTQSSSNGCFVWYELMTSEPDAAIAFHTDVVGWETTPFEGSPIPYTMWTKGETPVGGVLEMPAERPVRRPPGWGHVRVDDVDAVAARVQERGGTILQGRNRWRRSAGLDRARAGRQVGRQDSTL